jgi:hypothetical protein
MRKLWIYRGIRGWVGVVREPERLKRRGQRCRVQGMSDTEQGHCAFHGEPIRRVPVSRITVAGRSVQWVCELCREEVEAEAHRRRLTEAMWRRVNAYAAEHGVTQAEAVEAIYGGMSDV